MQQPKKIQQFVIRVRLFWKLEPYKKTYLGVFWFLQYNIRQESLCESCCYQQHDWQQHVGAAKSFFFPLSLLIMYQLKYCESVCKVGAVREFLHLWLLNCQQREHQHWISPSDPSRMYSASCIMTIVNRHWLAYNLFNWKSASSEETSEAYLVQPEIDGNVTLLSHCSTSN